jgi:hypothetical protein
VGTRAAATHGARSTGLHAQLPLPALDTALTIALATGSVAIATVATQWAGSGDSTSSPDFLGHAGGEYLLAAGAAVLSAVAGVSAARGYSRVARCNAARDAQPAPGAAGVDRPASAPPGYGQ